MKNEAEIYEKLISLYGAEKAAKLLQDIKAESGDPPPSELSPHLWNWDPGPEWQDSSGHFHKGGIVTDFGKAGVGKSFLTGTKPNVMFMSSQGWEELGKVKDMSIEVDTANGTVQSVSMVTPPEGVEGPEPTMIHLDEVGVEADAFSPEEDTAPDPGEDTEPQQWGDDRAAKYVWTPEQLEKADPSHPEPGLEMPDVVFQLLNEREKLAGRDPLMKEEEDVEEG